MSDPFAFYDAWKTTDPMDRWEEPENDEEEADDPASEDWDEDYQ